MNDYTISIIENIDQFNKIYTNFYAKSINMNTGIHIIGLDCEYISKSSHQESFDKADWCIRKGNNPVVCKLQLACENMCIIIDLCKIGKTLPENLINILKSESWIKCGAGIGCDMDHLSYQYDLGHCNGSLNISIFCRYFGMLNPNLENIYNTLIKKDNFKKEEFKGKDWSKEMTVSQIKYASEDAIASYMIGIEFLNHMKNSLNVTLNKQPEQHIENNETKLIEVKVSNENYVGVLLEYIQKKKLKPPTFDFELDIDKNNNTKKFYCKCQLQLEDSVLNVKSDSFSNKKDAKHDVSKKILEHINK